MPRTAVTQFEAFFFFVFGLIRGFEVVNGAYALHDDCSGADLGNDLLYALVGHRGFVQGVGHYASCVDALHLILELLHREGIERRTTAHKASGPMRSRAIPIFVSRSNADQAAIPHVDRDEQLFSLLGRNRALPKNHGVRINVVVDGGENVHGSEPHAIQDNVHHGLAIEDRALQ